MCMCRNQCRFLLVNVKSKFSTSSLAIITPTLLRSMVYLCNGSTKSSNACKKKKLPNGSLICSLNPKKTNLVTVKSRWVFFFSMCNAVSFRLSHFFPLHPNFSHLCWFMYEGYVGWVYQTKADNIRCRLIVKFLQSTASYKVCQGKETVWIMLQWRVSLDD